MPTKSQDKSSAIPRFPGLWQRITTALSTDKTSEIANIVGVKQSSVSEWKAGPNPPSLDSLLKIATYGDTSVDWLLRGDDYEQQFDSTPEGLYKRTRRFLAACVDADTAAKVIAIAEERDVALADLVAELLRIGIITESFARSVPDLIAWADVESKRTKSTHTKVKARKARSKADKKTDE